MSGGILADLKALVVSMGIRVFTAVGGQSGEDEYIAIEPLSDSLEQYSDNEPQSEIQEAWLSLYSRYDYVPLKNRLTKALLNAGFDITDRHYAGWDKDVRYHHYVIDVAKEYYFDQHDQEGEM